MMLTETHQVNKGNPLYDVFDNLCFKAKNLYNAGLYIHSGKVSLMMMSKP